MALTSKAKKFFCGFFLVGALILGIFTNTTPSEAGNGMIIPALILIVAASAILVLFLPEKEEPTKRFIIYN